MIKKLNTMIKNGNSTAKRWTQQRRSQLTVNKIRRVYNKLSYITGKQSNKTRIVVQIQRDGKTKILQEPDAIAQAFNHTAKNTSHKPNADSLIQQTYKM
jgi:hypothetical protein